MTNDRFHMIIDTLAFKMFLGHTPHPSYPLGQRRGLSRTSCNHLLANDNNRVILPLKRIELSEREISKLIPTLSDRQFVVAKDKLSEAESQLQRELFWYREALFKSVRGHWKEVRSSLALPFKVSKRGLD